MNRRSFLKGLLVGLITAPAVARAVISSKPSNLKVYKDTRWNPKPILGPESLYTPGIIYAPYIPLLTTHTIDVEKSLIEDMSLSIQKQIDREIMDKCYTRKIMICN